jgi:glycosyltransferase involved in cell wall biosynthesis
MKVSMVTTVLNRADLIDEALDSVAGQAGVEVEHIVVDAGSTDGTREILAARRDLRVIDLPGSTPEEALNEGIRRATGDVIGLIMSDDRLAPGILNDVGAAFAADPACDVVSAGAVFFAADAEGRDEVLRRFDRRPAIDLDYVIVLLGPLMACARFYRRTLFDRVGFFEQTYRACNDRDLLWRMIVAGAKNVCLERVAYFYRSHSGSTTIGGGSATALRIAADHLDMAEAWLARPDLPVERRRELGLFHAVEATRGTVRALRALRPWQAAKIAWRGLRRSPVFFLVALREIRALRRRLAAP